MKVAPLNNNNTFWVNSLFTHKLPHGFIRLSKDFLSGIGFIPVATSHLAHFLTWNCLE